MNFITTETTSNEDLNRSLVRSSDIDVFITQIFEHTQLNIFEMNISDFTSLLLQTASSRC